MESHLPERLHLVLSDRNRRRPITTVIETGECMISEEFVPDWDVYRDDTGRPVTITADQIRAVWHALRVVEQVRSHKRYPESARVSCRLVCL